jgi:hypothetical protein
VRRTAAQPAPSPRDGAGTSDFEPAFRERLLALPRAAGQAGAHVELGRRFGDAALARCAPRACASR